MGTASREELEDYLRGVPGAPSSWLDVFLAAKLSVAAVDAMVRTMMQDPESPLRAAEDSLLSREIVRVNGVFGDLRGGSERDGRVIVRINVLLTRNEATRVDAVVSNFCQVSNASSRRFASNGHSVCNAVRRVCTGYLLSKFAEEAKIIEIGPDVKHWLMDTDTREWVKDNEVRYVGARPAITRRDVVRMSWKAVAARAIENRDGFYTEAVVDRAKTMIASYDSIFPNKRLEHLDARGDYIVSNDAQYDFPFDRMPEVMVRVGARGWHGYMLRVKGLSGATRLVEGTLTNTGVNYRVDWKKGRVVFRHPTCSAFAYTHDVWELIKYEERNGYVWHTERAHYVYAKGPETNEEVLFFSVARVVKAIYMTQPTYIDNPLAGRTRIKTVWAVGGWSTGVPTKFEPVEFAVDSLAFGKILERRVAQDVRGDLNQTMVLVKSVNVRMWLNGTPVGTNRRIETQLLEAVAVVVEVVAAEMRQMGAFVFSRAMREYKVSIQRSSYFMQLLESLVDIREMCGSIAGPVTRLWGQVRGSVIDAALSSLGDMSIVISREEDFICLGQLCPQVCGEGIDAVEVGALDSWRKPIDPDKFVSAVVVPEVSDSSDDGVVESEEDGTTTEVSSVADFPKVVSEPSVGKDWREVGIEDYVEARAMNESINLKRFLMECVRTETRVDATRLSRSFCRSDKDVLQHCTTRTQHTLVRFKCGRLISTMGFPLEDMGAVYCYETDKFFPVTYRGGLAQAVVSDGWYYTSNHLRVWNTDLIIEALEYALSYGRVGHLRQEYNVTLGVFGAGKTYSMMRAIASMYAATGKSFLVLSVTKKASREAIDEGVKAGLRRELLEARVVTLDRYLIHMKTPADYVAVDEFPMAHTGDVDAAVSISRSREVHLYGDGRQIPYDPFTAAFEVRYGMYGTTVDMAKVKFMPVTHRSPVDVCSAWVDMYPSIRSCDCCNLSVKKTKSMEVVRVGTLADVPSVKDTRVHTYTRADYEAVKDGLHIRGDRVVLKQQRNGGISTVHEDQGASHLKVATVRYTADYDKKASKRNPSLFNRPSYVLTDMTRHKHAYTYYTLSREDDMVVKRVACAEHDWRRKLAESGEGAGLSTLEDMLTGSYHPDIVDGSTLRHDYKG